MAGQAEKKRAKEAAKYDSQYWLSVSIAVVREINPEPSFQGLFCVLFGLCGV